MSNDDTEEEASFRERYAQELQKKKQQAGDDELADERRSVNQQGMRTPGRRGEEIKREELDKEYVRLSKGEIETLEQNRTS
jgi:hypothetical protein